MFKKRTCRVSWLACPPSETPSHTLCCIDARLRQTSVYTKTDEEETERRKRQVVRTRRAKETPELSGFEKGRRNGRQPATADVVSFPAFFFIQSFRSEYFSCLRGMRSTEHAVPGKKAMTSQRSNRETASPGFPYLALFLLSFDKQEKNTGSKHSTR